MSTTYTPVILCGCREDDVFNRVPKDVLDILLEEDKLQTGYTSTDGFKVVGVPATMNGSHFLLPEELSSNIDGAMQLFQLRTGIPAQTYLCIQEY